MTAETSKVAAIRKLSEEKIRGKDKSVIEGSDERKCAMPHQNRNLETMAKRLDTAAGNAQAIDLAAED